MKHNLVMLAALFLAFPAGAEAGDMEDIVAAIEKRWTDTAKKQIDPGASNPAGSWLATSQGGLWQFQSPAEAVAMITDSPNTLAFQPMHINVQIMGSEKDVAYATYYLVGNVMIEGKPLVTNYRTRASTVYVKIGGKWLTSGEHYSPLYGGSGVVFD